MNNYKPWKNYDDIINGNSDEKDIGKYPHNIRLRIKKERNN
jgi:hypothetical protein